ncbi:MAG: DUF2877 domain-containing protein [Proteobacteria bacterium]|nr:DUF2877 domain-containing protein [Pseudomonadota bacterium]
MIDVQAQQVGADVATSSFAGAVEMVFAHACAVALDDGRRLTLLAGPDEQGMRIIAPSEGAWHRLHPLLQVGGRVTANDGVLYGDGFRVGYRRNATLWRSPAFQGHVPADGWGPNLVEAKAHLDAAQHELPPEMTRTAAYRRFATLCRTLQREEAADEAVRGLIGLGPGLTPSGDDLLCGLLGGLAAAGDTRFSIVRRAVMLHLDRTTSASKDYLSQACTPWWTGLLHGFFAAIAAPAGDIPGAFRRLAARGHSSGIDQAAGLVAGLALAAGRTDLIPSL